MPQVQATGDVARSTQFSSRFRMGKTIAGRKKYLGTEGARFRVGQGEPRRVLDGWRQN